MVSTAAVGAVFALAATTELTMIVAEEGPIRTLLAISGLRVGDHHARPAPR
ncbi:hypothetical protein [Mycolicibacterium sarraceniae]|uniref:hypothetical protein n=1 Tax=Mycolicibacterium sarraceniae TaxID=1534348 RepID=UPI0013D4DC0D|nr:hypothetical protein [Mycolicibacterium sarraceniae]